MSFDWTTLGEYARVQGGYAYKSNDFTEAGVCPVLKIKNVRVGTVDYSETSFISEKIANDTFEWRTKEGDILISMTGSGPNAPQSLVGRVARIWGDEPEAWINQRVGRLVLNQEDLIHPDFLFYILSSQRSQDFLVSNSSGSANQANISGKTIESLPCPKIDYDRSANIAKTLRNFDQKIILNRQINQTLESMAQAIFQSWFVDFDPVKAKIAAREQWQILTDDQRTEWLNELLDTQDYFKTCLLELTAKAGLSDDENVQLDSSLDFISCRGYGPESSENLDIGLNNLRKEWQSKKVGPALQNAAATLYLNIAAMTAISSRDETSLAEMPADEFSQLYKTASLFPKRFVDSELGEIPEGWEFKRLSDLADKISKGTTPNKKDIANSGDSEIIPFLKVRDISDDGEIQRNDLDMIQKSIHESSLKRSILKKDDLLFSIAGTIGRVAVVEEDLSNSNCNQALAFIRLLEPLNFLEICRLNLVSKRVQDEVLSKVVQGVQSNFSLTGLGNIEILIPESEFLNEFNSIVNSLRGLHINNSTEIRNLGFMRDTLLPKLLSGELDVSSLTELSDIDPAEMDV
jgi:restriction endonuclease S subunit